MRSFLRHILIPEFLYASVVMAVASVALFCMLGPVGIAGVAVLSALLIPSKGRG